MNRIESDILKAMSDNWGWMLAMGIIMVVLGTIGLGATFTMTVITVTFFGFLFMFGGVAQFIDAIRYRSIKSPWGGILIAILYVVAGFIMVTKPLPASVTLTMFIAWTLIAIGIIRVVAAFQTRPASGWGWILFAGIISVVLGIMILNNWPVSGLWVIGMFVAIELIFNGWGMIMLSLAARKAGNMAA